jgi:hypothetical protein
MEDERWDTVEKDRWFDAFKREVLEMVTVLPCPFFPGQAAVPDGLGQVARLR